MVALTVACKGLSFRLLLLYTLAVVSQQYIHIYIRKIWGVGGNTTVEHV